MKKIYLFLLTGIAVLNSQAQGLQVSLSSLAACAGETVTATVKGPALEMVSPATGANNQNGVMFDVTAAIPVIIKGFTVNTLDVSSDFEIYYRTGSFVGFENASTGWTLLGSSTGIPLGNGQNTGIELDQPILAGQTLAFYVTCTG